MKNNIDTTLVTALKKVYDDREFIIGVLSRTQHDDDKKKILNFIEVGEEVDDETVMVMAIELNRERKKK